MSRTCLSSKQWKQVNERQKGLLFEKVQSAISAQSCRGLTFAIWGLAFKPTHRRYARRAGDHRHRIPV